MNITLEFNGKQYTIPSDIKEYLKILDITESTRRTLLENFSKKSADSYDGIVYPSDMKSAFTEEAEKYVKLLCEKEIYSETVEDFIAASDGYGMFSKISEDASRANLQFSNEEKRNYQTRSQVAERNAMSKITGSGVSVYSSSFLTLAMSSAVEYSTLKGQYNKASEQYKRELSYLRSRGENERKIQEQKYYSSIYVPQVEKALKLFSYEMMRKYIGALIENKAFDQDTLKYVDLSHSQKLLSNLKLTSTSNKLLEMAFLACPFNINVYTELARRGKLNKETLESVQKLELLELLKVELERIFTEMKYTGDICADLNEADGIISALSLITGNSKLNYYKSFARPIYEKTIQGYLQIQKVASSKECGLQFLKSDFFEVGGLTKEEVIPLIEKKVRDIISDREFYALIEKCGFVDLIDKVQWESESTEKTKIDNYYIEIISRKLSDIVDETIKSIETQNRKNQKEQKRLQGKISIIKFMLVIIAVVPIMMIAILTHRWEETTKNYLNDCINESLYASQKNNAQKWTQIGGISGFEIEKLRVYKEGYLYIYIEAQIKYYVGNDNATVDDITEIVDNVYENIHISLPWYLATDIKVGDFAPWPYEITAQMPSGRLVKVDEMNSALQAYNHNYKGKVIYVSTPVSVIYFLLIGISFLISCIYIKKMKNDYDNSMNQQRR